MYKIFITTPAKNDLKDYVYHIHSEYKSPLTAKKHYFELRKTIEDLKTTAHIYQFQTNRTIANTYSPYVRRVNYKKMAILYIIHNNTVYILRIIAQSLIGKI